MKTRALLLAAAALAACTTPLQTPAGRPAATAAALEPTRDASGRIQLPAGMDMSKLQSALPEPAGAGTPLGPRAPVTVAAAPGLPTHTIYFPSDLSASTAKEKLPVLVWGNGACANDGKRFEKTLTKIASHGFLVVAVGLFEPKAGAAATTGGQMIEGVDWAIKANSADGPLHGRIDTGHIALMGQSCGGLMTIEAAHDPRIVTIGVINSGVINGSSGSSRSMSSATKDTLKTIHTPALYINGGDNDAAFPNANDDYERIDHVPVFYGSMNGAGHIATHRHKNGGRFAEVITAWLQYQLRGDTEAGSMFLGPQCGLCTDPAWTVRRKKLN